jgi:hypothetical protein
MVILCRSVFGRGSMVLYLFGCCFCVREGENNTQMAEADRQAKVLSQLRWNKRHATTSAGP